MAYCFTGVSVALLYIVLKEFPLALPIVRNSPGLADVIILSARKGAFRFIPIPR